MWRAGVCLAVCMCVSVVSAARGEDHIPLTDFAQADWDAFSVDVTHRDSTVDEKGGEVPGSVRERIYRWQKRVENDRWRTVVTFVSATKDMARTLTGDIELAAPFGVSRIEDDEDGTPLRVYDLNGKRLVTPTPAQARAIGLEAFPEHRPAAIRPTRLSRDWIGNFVLAPGDAPMRRRALEQRYGRPQGRVRQLDRYIRHAGGSTTEVLVHPDATVPIEINVARDGQLVAHRVVTYAPGADGSLLKHRVRSELASVLKRGHRDVVDVVFANPKFERKGGRR